VKTQLENLNKKIILTTAEMGYGHLRALYPFYRFPEYQFTILGQTDNSDVFEKKLWKITLYLYETISRFKNVPIIGWFLFKLMSGMLAIPPKNKQVKNVERSFSFWMLERMISFGLCKGIQKQINSENILFTSFYAPVIALEKNKSLKVFCQICDTDLSRVWVTRNPSKSNTQYFAPCKNATDRLLSYGVDQNKIHLTGFPLPAELVGNSNEEIAIKNLEVRIALFDNPSKTNPSSPLQIAYIVGGAGAYSEIGKKIARSFRKEIENGLVVLHLVAGVKRNVAKDYYSFVNREFPNSTGIKILSSNNITDYFQQFTELISRVHLIWTKPSELVFYSALGIPIIMTDPLGPQEEANREWMLETGAGIDQHLSNYTNLWVLNKLNSGVFSRMARNGWDKGIRTAVFKIPELIIRES